MFLFFVYDLSIFLIFVMMVQEKQNITWRARMLKYILAISLFFAGISLSVAHNQSTHNTTHWKQTEQLVSTSLKVHRKIVSLKRAYTDSFSSPNRFTINPYRITYFNRLVLAKLNRLSKQTPLLTPAYAQIPARVISSSPDEDPMNA